MRKLTYLIIILVLIKIFFIFDNVNRFGLNLGSDESKNFKIASNYLQNKGFTYQGRQTALDPMFSMLTYAFLQKLGAGEEGTAVIIHIFSVLLYIISLVYFHKMTNWGFTLLYGLYPSVIYYVGSFSLYENITLPIMIIVMYKLLKNSLARHDFILVPGLAALSCLYRHQLIFIYAGIFLLYFFRGKKKLAGMVILALCLAYAPIILRNHAIFGKYILSTKTGFQLFHGHNPFARGAYYGDPNSEIYGYLKEKIPVGLNEYEESMAHQRLALEWIRANPGKELKLMARKAIIYFLPQNFAADLPGNKLYNPINLIVHILFLLCLLKFQRKDMLILSPIIFSFLLCLIFFVSYRFRYFAEPFMMMYIYLTGLKGQDE
jgi:hypothetical protein